ncbi:major facilitator superfamily domain-containing protein 6-like [Daphnia carinata]|uniref:major facilitator superfamily domain-containing protein 6-like n=1 Tax=Daphnia carinata TaxID=120202 RepID=UPI00257D8542|nr:major facilitator superfamily domain-containing protein 6-like [Daphnia carinata]
MATNPFGNYYPSEGDNTQQFTYPDSSGNNYAYDSSSAGLMGDSGNNLQHQPMGAGMAEVDLSRYPEPKESTKKIRGRADIIEYFFGGPVNRELIIAKAFYFCFFSAFGSLLPLMAIYFKNMGMTPTQAGILIGIRPFVGYLSAPFWADLADRFKKGRIMLLGSLAAWIIFNVPLGLIRPPAISCLIHNSSDFVIVSPTGLVNRIDKRSISPSDYYDVEQENFMAGWTPRQPEWIEDHHQSGQGGLDDLNMISSKLPWNQLLAMEEEESVDIPLADEYGDNGGEGRVARIRRHATPSPMKPDHVVGMSPYSVKFAANYQEKENSQWVSPTFSYTIFNRNDIRKVFFLFLLLIVIGEFFCCPSMTLADTAVLNLLGKENADQYGRQRMFASIGWGLTMFFVCLTLDHSTPTQGPNHPCQVHERERVYTVCYVSFTMFMIGTMIVATRLPFNYDPEPQESLANPATVSTPEESTRYVPPAPGSWYHPKGPPPPPPGSQHHPSTKEVMNDALKNLLGKSKVFAQTTSKIPEWMPVLRHMANIRCASFMFVAWFMGFGIGLIFTFLFWHLQDYGGTSTVFGMASVVNHISEMLAYFLSYPLIRKIGHIKVLCLGLLCSVLRFLYISYIREPWGVIPFELIQGVTHSAVWAAACSYIAHNTPPELRVSAQGVLSFVHNGAGRACGTIFGGLFSTYYGTTAVLRGYGFACIFVLVGFVLVCFYHRGKGLTTDLTPAEDPHQVAAEMAHLAPHGVPGNPTIVRTASTANLENSASKPTLNYNTSHGNLDIPHVGGMAPPTNPFLASSNNQPTSSSFGYVAEEYNGISMNPTQSGSVNYSSSSGYNTSQYNNSQY